mgnify:CR=1 FL=1
MGLYNTTAKQVLNYYKKEFNITDKNIIIEDLQRQVEYIVNFSDRRENYILKLEKGVNNEWYENIYFSLSRWRVQ